MLTVLGYLAVWAISSTILLAGYLWLEGRRQRRIETAAGDEVREDDGVNERP